MKKVLFYKFYKRPLTPPPFYKSSASFQSSFRHFFGRLSSGFRAAHRTYKSCLNFFINEFDLPGHPPFMYKAYKKHTFLAVQPVA